MPTYEYRCSHCKHKLEAVQKVSEPALDTCPECKNATLQRRPGGIGLAFSGGGEGFYANMYGKKESKEPSSSGGCCPCGKSQNSCGS